MNRPAVIYGHPSAIHTPEDVAKMEQQKGRRAVITKSCVRLDPVTEDPYDMVDRQSWLSTPGAYEGDAA